MNANTKLVNHLKALLVEADAVMRELTDTEVTADNYQQLAYLLDSTSGCVITGLFEVREFVIDAIDQYEG